IVITRAELNAGQLRLEGQGAQPNASISIDGTVRGTASAGGLFRIQLATFSSPTCKVTVSDGVTSAAASLIGCTPAPPPPPPPPAPPPSAAPAGTWLGHLWYEHRRRHRGRGAQLPSRGFDWRWRLAGLRLQLGRRLHVEGSRHRVLFRRGGHLRRRSNSHPRVADGRHLHGHGDGR